MIFELFHFVSPFFALEYSTRAAVAALSVHRAQGTSSIASLVTAAGLSSQDLTVKASTKSELLASPLSNTACSSLPVPLHHHPHHIEKPSQSSPIESCFSWDSHKHLSLFVCSRFVRSPDLIHSYSDGWLLSWSEKSALVVHSSPTILVNTWILIAWMHVWMAECSYIHYRGPSISVHRPANR